MLSLLICANKILLQYKIYDIDFIEKFPLFTWIPGYHDYWDETLYKNKNTLKHRLSMNNNR